MHEVVPARITLDTDRLWRPLLYLKLVYEEHEAQGTLDATDMEQASELTVDDLGAVFTRSIPVLADCRSGP